MLPLAAYADRLSVRPGETIKFQVANASGKPVAARMVRVISSDANPAGPGIQVEEVDTRISKLTEPGPSRGNMDASFMQNISRTMYESRMQ